MLGVRSDPFFLNLRLLEENFLNIDTFIPSGTDRVISNKLLLVTKSYFG